MGFFRAKTVDLPCGVPKASLRKTQETNGSSPQAVRGNAGWFRFRDPYLKAYLEDHPT